MGISDEFIGIPNRIHRVRSTRLNLPAIVGSRNLEFAQTIITQTPDDDDEVVIKEFYVKDPFEVATLNDLIWDTTLTGTGTVTISNGTCVVDSGTGGGVHDAALHADKFDKSDNGIMRFRGRVKRNKQTTNTSGFVGFGREVAPGTIKAGWEAVGGGAVNEWVPNVNGTTGGTYTVPNDTYVEFRVDVKDGSVDFYINQQLKETISVDISTEDIVPTVYAFEGAGGALNFIWTIDWCSYEYRIT